MSLVYLAQMIGLLSNLVAILVIIWVVVTWVLPPYHPLRELLDRIIDPMLAPIRRVLPMAGMIDLSPMILIILVTLVSRILISLLLSVR
jgi:YggT family protein